VGGVILAALLVILTISRPTSLEQLEFLGYDSLLRAVADDSPNTDIVIVDVDEASLAELGQWPWPRYRIARIIDRLREAGAASIGIDFIFAEPDRLSLSRLQESFQDGLNVTIGLDGVPAEVKDNDAILAQAVAPPDVVSGVWFAFDPPAAAASTAGTLPPVVVRRSADAPESVPVPLASRATMPMPTLSHTQHSIGFLNALPDSDGKIRRSPLLIQFEGNHYPSLALMVVMRARSADQAIVSVNAAGVESVRFADTTIPTDRQGGMLLSFGSDPQGRFAYVSAADLLAGRTPTEALRGKVAFLGSSAAGLKDIHATPIERDLPGVQVHAVAAAAMLAGEFSQSPAWSVGARAVLVLFASLLISLALVRYRITVCAVVCIALLLFFWFGTQWLFGQHGLFVSPVMPMLAAIGSFILLGLVRFRHEELSALQRTRELAAAQDCAILGLVSIAETRDPETGHHIIRTQRYVAELAAALAVHPRFREALGTRDVDAIYRSAPLHDIGKVGVPDSILLKPAGLTDDEFEIMKQHTTIGHKALSQAEDISGLDKNNSFLRCASEIALAHHEKWDGSGYPNGIKGLDIPVSARLMALADVYDALRSKRHYKPAFPHDKVVAILEEGRGTHFDPDVVDAFLLIQDQFIAIADEYTDENEPTPGGESSEHAQVE
jgi:adenylate cyclase